jgi:hypothetical protein
MMRKIISTVALVGTLNLLAFGSNGLGFLPLQFFVGAALLASLSIVLGPKFWRVAGIILVLLVLIVGWNTHLKVKRIRAEHQLQNQK